MTTPTIPVPHGITLDDLLDAVDNHDLPGHQPNEAYVGGYAISVVDAAFAGHPVTALHRATIALASLTPAEYARLETLAARRAEALAVAS